MAHLPPLATADDCITYGYPLLDDAVLLRASTRVRRHTRQQITPDTTTTVLTGVGPWLLPQRPVVAVTEVLDSDGEVVDPDLWTLSGQHLETKVCPPLTVTFDHGYAELQDELVELVCAIATRLAAVPDAVAAGARTEQAGGETVTWGVEAFAGTVDLTTAEKTALNHLFPRYPRTAILL